MADSTFNVTIVTPDGTIVDQTTDLLVLTTVEGQMGLMKNHQPIIASLAIDALRLKNAGQEDTVAAVNGGFIDFDGQVATVVAGSAELAANIDVARAKNAKERAEKAIEQAKQNQNPDDLARAEVHLARALNRLKVSGGIKG